MTRNSNVAGAAACGGATCVILICLFVIGIPTLIAGLVLVSTFDETEEIGEGPHTAGIVCIVLACVMIVAGIITAIFTCVFVGRAANSPRTPTTQVISTQVTHTTGYPAVSVQQGQGQFQGQAYYPNKGQGEYPQVHVPPAHPTPQQYAGNQNAEYIKY